MTDNDDSDPWQDLPVPENFPGKGHSAGQLSTAEEYRYHLGLAISGALLIPGESRSIAEIAEWTGVTRQAIAQVELRALRRLRNAVQFGTKRSFHELIESIRSSTP